MQITNRKIKKYSIKEVEPLINSLVSRFGNEKEVCKRLKYNEGYLSQLRSREENTGNPQVSEKFKKQMEGLQNANPGKPTAPAGPAAEILANLKEIQDYAKVIITQQDAGNRVILASLERLEGKPPGELVGLADMLAAKIQESLARVSNDK